jgi:hypothetical protein
MTVRFLGRRGNIEKHVQEVEQYLTEKGITIHNYGQGLSIHIRGIGEFPLYESDTQSYVTHFPRSFEEQRLSIREDLIESKDFLRVLNNSKGGKTNGK